MIRCAPLPADEPNRLTALRRYRILDTKPEARFDRITRMVCDLMRSPISLISLVDQDRQWFKSKRGLSIDETSRDLAFCAYAILSTKVMEVADTHQDSRFANHPLVVGPPFIRTYVGAPLQTFDGFRLGTLCAIYNNVVPIESNHVKLLQDLAAIVVDEMELRRRSLQLKSARARSEVSQSAKTAFLSTISHELRTPLTGVLGMMDLLSGSKLNPTQSAYVQQARTCSLDLLKSVNQMLDYCDLVSGGMRLEYASFSLRQVLKQTLDALAPIAAKKNLPLTSKVDGEIPVWIKGDAQRLRQILTYLIENAIKFTDAGEIHISADVKYVDGKRRLVLGVRDTGCGIIPSKLEVIFQPFHQNDMSLSKSAYGIGMGLAICKKLVEQQGGCVGVQSFESGGSLFWVDLPCETAAPKQSVDTRGSEAITRAAVGLNVLIADDHKANQEVIRRLVEAAGYKATVVENGREAVECSRNEQFDVIIMDIRMPIMDGITAARKISELETGNFMPAIVALTADRISDPDKFYENGFSAVLQKPVEMQTLIETIRSAAGSTHEGASLNHASI